MFPNSLPKCASNFHDLCLQLHYPVEKPVCLMAIPSDLLRAYKHTAFDLQCHTGCFPAIPRQCLCYVGIVVEHAVMCEFSNSVTDRRETHTHTHTHHPPPGSRNVPLTFHVAKIFSISLLASISLECWFIIIELISCRAFVSAIFDSGLCCIVVEVAVVLSVR